MNVSMFNDWIEDRLFGDSSLAHLMADIVDEAMARDTPGDLNPSEHVDEGMLHSAWQSAEEQDDELVRCRVAVVLGRLGYSNAEEVLDRARACDDPEVTRAAAVALARIRPLDVDLTEALVEAVEDPAVSREVRSSAARQLAAKGDHEVLTRLVELAQSDDPDLAQYGIDGLGDANTEPETPEHNAVLSALCGGLKTGDALTTVVACEALGRFGDPAAIPELEQILIQKDPSIRRRAVFALAKLGADSAKAPLTRMVRDFSIPARWEIVDLLGECYGESMIDALALAAQDGDAEIRDHVVAALVRMEGDSSLDLLQHIARDDRDPFVREQAQAALAARGAEPSEPEPDSDGAGDEPAERAGDGAAAPPTPRAAAPAPPAPKPTRLRPLYAAPPPAAPPSGPEPDAQNLIERSLDLMECKWWTDANGYQAEVPVEGGAERISILLGESDYEQSPLYRFVAQCGPATDAAFEAALRNNRDLDYGAIAIEDVAGAPFFVLTDTVLASTASPASVRKTVVSLARAQHALRG
jgi:HEAT repeat protein